MDTIDAMRVFVAVVERNGFSAAADALDVSTAAVTRQVAALEKRLSTRLLHRTTRRVSPTSAGAAYYQRCVQLLAEFDALEASVSAQALQPSGRLRINAPVSYGIARLGALLPAYSARYPQVELDLQLSDRLVDMVEEGFDLAIRIIRQPAPNLIARQLGLVRIRLCAAPSYLAQRGTPSTPQDLSGHQCLSYTYSAGGDTLQLQGPEGEFLHVAAGADLVGPHLGPGRVRQEPGQQQGGKRESGDSAHGPRGSLSCRGAGRHFRVSLAEEVPPRVVFLSLPQRRLRSASMTRPRAMRYHPKGWKPMRLMWRSTQRTTNSATTKAAKKPIAISLMSPTASSARAL